MVLPGLSASVPINVPREFDEWLEWGDSKTAAYVEIKKGVDVTISDSEGDYCGEW